MILKFSVPIMIEYLFFILILIATILVLIRTYLKCSIKQCTSNVSMDGRVIIITGANTGIGYHVAVDLARRGGRVILACRNKERGETAKNKIVAESGNKNVVFKHLNLSSLKSVRTFAEDIKNTEERLDVLVNNAGVHGLGDRYTEDGIVEGMQINYFAPFLLSLLLLPMLKKSKGRIVNVSSLCHYRGVVNFDKINKAGAYSGTAVYANSKLCSIIFTKALAQKVDGEVTVNALHPGVILTNIVPNESPVFTWAIFRVWCWLCNRTAEEGAQTIIYLAVADEVRGISGKYFVDCSERFVLWTANNKKLAKELWSFSEELVKIK